MTTAKLRLAMAAMGQPKTKDGELCRELDITVFEPQLDEKVL
jgi:hypothetical protein